MGGDQVGGVGANVRFCAVSVARPAEPQSSLFPLNRRQRQGLAHPVVNWTQALAEFLRHATMCIMWRLMILHRGIAWKNVEAAGCRPHCDCPPRFLRSTVRHAVQRRKKANWSLPVDSVASRLLENHRIKQLSLGYRRRTTVQRRCPARKSASFVVPRRDGAVALG